MTVPSLTAGENLFPTANVQEETPSPFLLQFLPKERHVSLNFWTRIKVKFHKLDENQIKALVSLSQLSKKEVRKHWNEILDILTQSLQNCRDKKQAVIRDQIKEILQHLTPEMLDSIVQELVKADIKCKHNKSVKTILKMLSLEQMESLLRHKHEDAESVEQVIRAIVPVVPPKPPPMIRKAVKSELKLALTNFLNLIPNLINTFLSAFRLFDLGKEPENAWEANEMLDVYYKLFAIPASLVVLIQATIGVAWQIWALSATVIFLGIVLVYIYIRWLKPCPEKLPNTENLTLEAKMDQLQPVIGRDREINFLLSHYSSCSKKKARHIILVGPSDVGKSEIVKGIAQRIASGNVPKKMKNKKIFVINTGRLAEKGFYGFASQLDIIFQRIKKYEQEVILFFEELHSALKVEGLPDYLKTHLERGKVQCIATTTLEAYQEFFPIDNAFSRRFQKLEIKEMSENHIKNILFKILEDHSDLLIDEEAVMESYRLTTTNEVKGCQPSNSEHLLLDAMDEVRFQQVGSDTRYRLQELEAKLEYLQLSCTHTSMRIHPSDLKTKQLYEQIQNIQAQVERLRSEAGKQKSKLKKARYLLKQRKMTRETMYGFARSFLAGERKASEQKAFIMHLEYVLPALLEAIEKYERVLGEETPIRVTREMVRKKFREKYPQQEREVA